MLHRVESGTGRHGIAFVKKNRNLWTWLSLNFFIGVIHPRILFYLNKLIPKLQRSVVTKNTQNYVNDKVESALFDQKVMCASVSDPSMKRINISKPEFLDNGYLRSSEGLIAFKKLPTSPVLPAYLECQLEGLTYFDKVFRGENGCHSSYNDIMIEHHHILATGLEGERNYKVGGISKEYSKDVAGKLRPTEGRVAFVVGDKKMVNAILRALTEIEFYPDGEWEIQIDEIPPDAKSIGTRVKQGFSIMPPDAKYIPLYFSKMDECLSLIRLLSSEIEIRGYKDRNSLPQALAAYFHLGIHAHAFVRINQSLLMAQVNYILMLNRFRPVCHGYVDLAAAFLDSGDFRNYFTRYVCEHNGIEQVTEENGK